MKYVLCERNQAFFNIERKNKLINNKKNDKLIIYLFVAYISQILFSKMEELSSIHIKKYELNFIDLY